MSSWKAAYSSRTDLHAYGDCSLGLFALALRFDIEDLVSVAAEAITDGNDDKKCDIVYCNKDDGVAVVMQCYYSQKDRDSAPSNKASDLNTAISWLLQRDIDSLPERIVSAATELREGIQDGLITKLYVWYVHNLNESANCEQELQTVEKTASSAIGHNFPKSKIKIQALEVGNNSLEEWYNDSLAPILVSEEFKVKVTDGFKVDGPTWSAFVTAVPARFLHKVFKKHKTKLFSANVRDYLGSRHSDSNINHGIKQTAEQEGENFWAFNNGLTILVNSFDVKASKIGKDLIINGISIVNGAQTTGAIGSMKKAPEESAVVPVRFIQTNDKDLVHDVIRYNNSQNKVTASDFRSTDKIQKRLKEQFSIIPEAEYEGGRRGGAADNIQRRPNLLPSYTVGQALAAFHGNPLVAYNQKSDIWTIDKLYSEYFNEHTTAHHIVLSFSLLRAIEKKKFMLADKFKKTEQSLTSSEATQLKFFRLRGATYLLTSAIADCLEIFLDKRISNLFRVSFGDKASPKNAQSYWMPIVETVSPLCSHLEDAFSHGLKSIERVNKALATFHGLVEATSEPNAKKYNAFSKKVVIK